MDDTVIRFKQAQELKAAEIMLEAHRLQVRNDEFDRVSKIISDALNARVDKINNSFANLSLIDNGGEIRVVRTDDPAKVLKVTFNRVRHTIVFVKSGPPVPFKRSVEISGNGPSVFHRDATGTVDGTITDEMISTLVRMAVDSVLDLP